MRINVAVAGVKGRMSGQVVSSILESENMELVAGFDIHGVGEVIAPGIEISSPDSMDKVWILQMPQPQWKMLKSPHVIT
jgi:dihydrodipicolinate reductase